MKHFLMLRGEYDANNKRNIKDDSDMWLHLFSEIVGEEDRGLIWYKSNKERIYHYKRNIWIVTKSVDHLKSVDFVFARGGHPYYISILKKCTNAFKIYYGAGTRTHPKDGIKYDMILVDDARDLRENCKLWTKPAARQFKPLDVEKKYDVCYIANGTQAKIKGIKWMYKTVPSHLSVLHLGNRSKYVPPSNVKRRQVLRKDMVEMINQCRVGIVPYTDYDSAPRAISEMLACDVPVLAFDSVRVNWDMSPHFLIKSNKSKFWDDAEEMLAILDNRPKGSWCMPTTESVFFDVGINNIKNAANLIKENIK